MADIKKKSNQKKNPKMAFLPKEETTEPLTKNPSSKLVPLNFKVENELHREFKVFASERDMQMVDLFRICFKSYKEKALI